MRMGEVGFAMYEREARPLSQHWRADTAALRQWLGKRKQSLEAVRAGFEPLWREVREYYEPNIGKALLASDDRDAQASKREDSKILNSEPRLCVQRYAAGMQSGITNKAQPWCSIVAMCMDDSTGRKPRLNAWCNKATTEVLSALERGNFYRASSQVYPHAALMGTSCMMVLRGEELGEVSFRVVDEGDYWIAEDRYGVVDTLLRRISMTLAQAADEFYTGVLPDSWRDRLKSGKAEERVTVYNLICRNDGSEMFCDIPADRPFASIYWLPNATTDGTDGILDIRSYSYKPFAVLRHSDCGSVYGKGIGETTLADNKELQELEDYELRMIANEATPAMLAPSTLKGKPINQFPGGVTYYDAMMGTNAPIQRLFETREGVGVVEEKVRIITDRISRFWYNDLFAMLLQINSGNRTQKTATEISELSGEKVTLLGPVLTQTDDFLNDVIDSVFTILYADGVIPEAPQELQTGLADISVEYTSTIHAEMRAALKMRSINAMISTTAMLAEARPEIIDKINGDKIVDEVCRIYPGAADFILEDKEVAAIREARAQAQQQAQQQAQMMEIAKTAGQNAKALSETRIGNGNALEQLMGAYGG